jgi:hypothetical protein
VDRGQGVRISGQEPTAVGLLAVDRETITSELRRLSADAGGHGQRVPAPRVGDFADDRDLFQVTDATDLSLSVSRREDDGKSIPAQRLSARVKKHDIVGHQREQALKIAGIDGIDPS